MEAIDIMKLVASNYHSQGKEWYAWYETKPWILKVRCDKNGKFVWHTIDANDRRKKLTENEARRLMEPEFGAADELVKQYEKMLVYSEMASA